LGDALSAGSSAGATSVLSENEFIERARAYLADIADVPEEGLDPDADLVASNLIDSLALVEFFAFIEEQRGSPIAPDRVSLDSLSTIRKAYELVST
jgi:acyl carrier protein